jgi:mannosyltransferase OCH1-like enzyme
MKIQDEDLRRYITTWTSLNPDYRYEMLTYRPGLAFVKQNYRDQPLIVRMYKRIGDLIMRANMLRYLLILKEGGLYTDLDTDCTKPIWTWIPLAMQNSPRMVLGVEWDKGYGE